MKAYNEKAECCGCSACMDICPTGAIHMVQDGEGFRYPYIKKSECISCGKCRQVCPLRNQAAGVPDNQYFGVQAKEEKIRYASSSGGIFPLLAQYVLLQGGVVYGAGYDEHMRVVHQEVSSFVQLDQIKRTKYVQSNADGVYRRIEQQLKEERWVLFCGTPCQADALGRFLDKAYERLITVGLICYGTPSPGIWEKYVKYLENEHGGKMTDFYFRDKRNKDNGHVCSYIIDGTEYAGSLYKDIYCRMFFKNNSIRPSCHSCKFCTVDRSCDFTIGDFWGIERVRPDMDDGMGTSLMIVHTEKAEAVWNAVKDEAVWFSCEKEEVLQPRLVEPTAISDGRVKFMMLYKILPFSIFLKWVVSKIG